MEHGVPKESTEAGGRDVTSEEVMNSHLLDNGHKVNFLQENMEHGVTKETTEAGGRDVTSEEVMNSHLLDNGGTSNPNTLTQLMLPKKGEVFVQKLPVSPATADKEEVTSGRKMKGDIFNNSGEVRRKNEGEREQKGPFVISGGENEVGNENLSEGDTMTDANGGMEVQGGRKLQREMGKSSDEGRRERDKTRSNEGSVPS